MFPLTPPKSDVFISVAVVIIAVVRRYLAYMGKSPLAASRSCSLAYLIQCLKESKRLKDFLPWQPTCTSEHCPKEQHACDYALNADAFRNGTLMVDKR